MKVLLVIVLTSCLSAGYAKNYYFSSTTGDDTRSDIQAQRETSPWKTLSKLNSIFGTLGAGDSVLLKKGDTFYGSVVVTKSGSADLPIVISSYGIGALPIITGFMTLSHWDLKENGVYTSSDRLNDSSLNIVVINNSAYAMGRYPNAHAVNDGWLPILSHVKNNSITSSPSFLNSDWTNAEVVIRKKHYVIDRNKIISQEGAMLNYQSGTQYEPFDSFGFFIQNHIKTLDQFGEWYYDPAIKKLHLYFGKKLPSNFKVEAGNVNKLVSIRNQSNISFESIALEGANVKSFDLYYSKNIYIKNCAINFSGTDAIDAYNTQNLMVENCTIANSNNNAFDLTGACNGCRIKNNIIKNSGLSVGMASNSSHSFSGININGDNCIIENNKIDSTGYIGIRFAGNSIVVRNNFINYFCIVKDDGGGIYTGNNVADALRKDQVIENNIVLNGIGASKGTPETTMQASGIYLDDNSANIRVAGNSLAYSNKAGILLHNCHDVEVTGNTLYANATQLIVQKDAASEGQVRKNSITNNIFFSQKRSQFVASFLTTGDDINLFGKIDNNYYGHPIDDNVIISTSYVDNSLGKVNRYLDLKGWESRFDKDKLSRKSFAGLASHTISKITSPNIIFTENNNTPAGVHGLKCKVVRQNLGLPGGGSVEVASLPNTISSYITIPVGKIDSGNSYVLKFSIKGSDDSDKTVGIQLRQKGSPYTNLAGTSYRTFSSSLRNYEILFLATQGEQNAFLVFTLNDEATTYQLDKLQLYQAKVKIMEPSDISLFEYNAGKTAKTITLNGKYTDTQNTTYTNSITLEPYTSVVLLKQN